MTTTASAPDHARAATAARQRWLHLLAVSPVNSIDSLCAAMLDGHSFEWLRQPETGLYRLQGRLDGAGDRFMLADVTVTRCALRSAAGTAGVGYVTGRAAHHCAQMARLDALLQTETLRDMLLASVIEPLAQALSERHAAERAATAHSRVNFYTMTPETL